MALKLNPLTGQMEEDGLPSDPNALTNVPMGGLYEAPAQQGPVGGSSPSGVTINLGGGGSSETDSTTVTTKSPSSTRKVPTKDLKQAAVAADTADQNARQAAVKKLEADQQLEQKALEAEQARQLQEWENFKSEERQREAIETHRQGARRAADKVEDESEQKVREAQDKSINWDDRKAPIKLLHGLLRSGSTRDSRILGVDPQNSFVNRTLDAALAAEKDKKAKKYLQSKEWHDVLKTKNADRINAE
jgi:hypothetical protein